MKTKKIFLIIVGLYILWHLFYLDKYPIIDMDDAWETEPSWTLLKTGKFAAPMFEGLLNLEKVDTYRGRLFAIAQIPFLIFGLTPYNARFVSLFFGFMVLILTYSIGKKLFNENIALWSTILVSISGLFIILTHRARRDIVLMVFMLLSLYFYLCAKERENFIFAFLSGFLASLSGDVHLNGFLIVPLWIFLLFLFWYKKGILSYLIGMFSGMIWFIITHIVISQKIFIEQMQGMVLGKHQPLIFSQINLIRIFLRELERYIKWYWSATGHRNMIELIILLTGMFFSFKFLRDNSKSQDKEISYGTKICMLTLIIFYLLLAIGAYKVQYYIIYYYPFIMFLFTTGIMELKKKNIFLSKFLLFILLCFYLLQIGYISTKYKDINYQNFINKVKVFIPEGKTVFGDKYLWFGFQGRNKFYSTFTYSYTKEIYTTQNINFINFLQEKNIEYVVLDERTLNGSEEIKSYLSNFNLIGTVEDNYFGSGGILDSSKKTYKTHIYKITQK
ncbi:MAG: glycosyltransferase family 39 protein [Candidatus Omnitrophica bacterium]|nr:glycosyltransferase family 39 protein [Candidatus Omnitrophota bacterium]